MEISDLEILSDKNVSTFSRYITKFLNIYIRPIKTWRDILYNHSSSLNDTVFYIICVGIIVVLLSSNNKEGSEYWLILELCLISLIPFSVLLLPYLFFNKIWKLNINRFNIIRLFIIINIQIASLISLLCNMADKFKIERLYIIQHNIETISGLLFLIVLPFLVRIKWYKKLLWILINYFFQLSFMFITSNIPEYLIINEKLSLESPIKEFHHFIYNYKKSDNEINDNYFLVLSHNINDKTVRIETIFPSYEILSMIDNEYVHNKRIARKIDSIAIENLSENYNNSMNLHLKLNKNDLIEEKRLIEIKKRFNNVFLDDLKFTDSIRKKTVFNDNKTLFNEVYNYLYQTNNLFMDSIYLKKIMKSENNKLSIDTKENGKFIIYERENANKLLIKKKKINKLFYELNDRLEKSYLSYKYLYYPHFYYYFVIKNKNRIKS